MVMGPARVIGGCQQQSWRENLMVLTPRITTFAMRWRKPAAPLWTCTEPLARVTGCPPWLPYYDKPIPFVQPKHPLPLGSFLITPPLPGHPQQHLGVSHCFSELPLNRHDLVTFIPSTYLHPMSYILD